MRIQRAIDIHPSVDTTRAVSPFDAIKHTDEYGEYWLGRELMPLVDYSRWEKFADVIAKAKCSLELVEGHDQAEHHFSKWGSDGGRWGRQQLDDVRLTRFGAYLTAMAGDHTKQAVAEARIYFAVKTREAEVQHMPTEIEVARKYLASLEANEKLTTQVAVLKPKAAIADEWLQSGDTVYVVEWAKTYSLTERQGFNALRTMGALFKREDQNVPRKGYEQYFDLVDEYVPGLRKWVKVPKLTAEGQTVLGRMLVEGGYAPGKESTSPMIQPASRDRRSRGDESTRPGGARP